MEVPSAERRALEISWTPFKTGNSKLVKLASDTLNTYVELLAGSMYILLSAVAASANSCTTSEPLGDNVDEKIGCTAADGQPPVENGGSKFSGRFDMLRGDSNPLRENQRGLRLRRPADWQGS
jgi:hypothetical protein